MANEKCTECGKPANAIFSDSARGQRDPLCAEHVEARKAAYMLRMDQFQIIGLPSDEPEPAPATAALPSTVDHAANVAAAAAGHAQLVDEHRRALDELDVKAGQLVRLKDDVAAAQAQVREHQEARAVAESRVASLEAAAKAHQEARMKAETRASQLATELRKLQQQPEPAPAPKKK